MSELAALGVPVEWTDQDAETAVRDRLESRWQLGRLGELAEWAAAVGAGDDGFTDPQAVVFDSVAADAMTMIGAVTRRPSGPLPGDVVAAITAGAALADARIDSGADLLIAAGPDTGTAAAIAVSVLTNTEPVKVVARGAAATDPVAWMERVTEVRDARRRCLGLRARPQELLAAIGSVELSALAGFVLQAAARHTPVVLDGVLAVAAAAVAFEAETRAQRWWCVADLGPDPAEALAQTRLGQLPVLGLGSSAGDGTAGALAVAVLQAAVQAGR